MSWCKITVTVREFIGINSLKITVTVTVSVFNCFGINKVIICCFTVRLGEKPAFECRKCGMRLPRHFGRGRRAKRMAHEQYCLGTAVANLTCRTCGELFVHMQARRLHGRFCANIRPEAA